MKMTLKTIPLGMCCLALLAPPRAGATISRDEAVLYVQNTWGFFDLSSDTISETLDTSYSGVPYSDWIDFLINAPSWVQPLVAGDYSTAARRGISYATDAGFTELVAECGLTGVAAPAALAVWPIQAALNNVAGAFNDDAFRDQCYLYFLARNECTYEQIITRNPPLGTIIQFTDPDGYLYIVEGAHEKAGYPRWYFASSAQFYEYAETRYQANKEAASFQAASSQIAQNFHDDATAPSIAVQPSSVTVSVGDTASFTVVASGTWPLHYQWRRNGGDISGATSWFYITPPALAANNGDQYSVWVSNAQGNRTSGTATLTNSGV